jgi:hypothetical protein
LDSSEYRAIRSTNGPFMLGLSRRNALVVLLTGGGLVVAGLLPQRHAWAYKEIVLTGRAQTADDTRDVRFAFSCTPSSGPAAIGSLEVMLVIPRHDQLRAVFDFDAFEGPSAHAGIHSSLEATGAGRSAQKKFSVNGWIGPDNDQPFVFGLAAGLRGDAARLSAVAKVVRPLTGGAGKLIWRQRNVRPDGLSIMATLHIAAADAARLRSLLSPCLAAASHAALWTQPAATTPG